MKRHQLYPLIIISIAILSYLLGLNTAQIASLTIFASFIVGTLLFWRFRLAFALVGIAALMALGLLTTGTLIDFASLDIILFLVCMMIVIGYLEEKRFFEYLIERLVRRVGDNPTRLIIVLLLMSWASAALVDEVTSILFMTTTALHISARYRINPIPLVIMIIFATNLGSSATVVGNPVGVLIALRGGLTFIEFIRWSMPLALLALILTIFLSLRYFSRYVGEIRVAMKNSVSLNSETIIEEHKEEDHRLSWILFIGTIGGLIAHSPIESILGLEKNTMLLGTALGAAGVTLFLYYDKARELVEKRVDWWTLSFFMFLFASVGTLKETGISRLLASSVIEGSGGDTTSLLFLVGTISGLMSAVMDNILAVATLIPIVQDIGNAGIPNYHLWWAMLIGSTYFGNLTPIGSTANIVGIGMLERRQLGHVTILEWIKPGVLISVPTLLLALSLLYLQASLI